MAGRAVPSPSGPRSPSGGCAVAERGCRVAGIVLAAGSSVRMGRNKLLMELGGETVVRRAVRAAVGAGLAPVAVVGGHEHERVRAQVDDLPCRLVFNSDHLAGTHTSVKTGVAAVRDECEAAMVILADMPLVTAAMVRELAVRYQGTGAPLVVSRYGAAGPTAPPILYDQRLFAELERMDTRCGRAVVRRHLEEAHVVEWPAERGRDLDWPEDYLRMRAGLAGLADGNGNAVASAGASAVAAAETHAGVVS